MPTYSKGLTFFAPVSGVQPPSTGTNVYSAPANGFAIIKINTNVIGAGPFQFPSIVINSRNFYFDASNADGPARTANMWVVVGASQILAISTGAGQTCYFYGLEFVNTT